jgi:hypothetical protein
MGSWSRTKRFIATGDTYPHRETFTSCAWHWDGKKKAWIEDNGSEEDDICILIIKDLPGVTVTVEERKDD